MVSNKPFIRPAISWVGGVVLVPGWAQLKGGRHHRVINPMGLPGVNKTLLTLPETNMAPTRKPFQSRKSFSNPRFSGANC